MVQGVGVWSTSGLNTHKSIFAVLWSSTTWVINVLLTSCILDPAAVVRLSWACCPSLQISMSIGICQFQTLHLVCPRMLAFLVSEAWPVQRRIVLLPYVRGVAVIVQMYSLFHLEALHSLLLAERLLYHLIVTLIVSLLSINLQTKTDTAMAEQLTAKLLSAFEVCLPELYSCHVQSDTPPANLQTRLYWLEEIFDFSDCPSLAHTVECSDLNVSVIKGKKAIWQVNSLTVLEPFRSASAMSFAYKWTQYCMSCAEICAICKTRQESQASH